MNEPKTVQQHNAGLTGQTTLFETPPPKPVPTSKKNTFDSVEGKRLKEQGMAQARAKRAEVLEAAKAFAIKLAKHYGMVHMDMVYEALLAGGFKAEDLGPAAGSVFRGKEWEFTGEWTKSKRVSNHRSDLRVWRLK